MKVGILTWYQAINHGAVLQTYSSCKMLESLGCSPVVLNYKWNLYSQNNRSAKIKRWTKKLSLVQVIWHIKVKHFLRNKIAAFNSFNELFLPIGDMYNKENGLDALYIGSDMVFDISEGYNPYMYGAGVDAPYKFSYAASFGYTTISKMESYEKRDEIVEHLKKLDAIGYRDQNTFNICNYYDVISEGMENIDPVLCYGFEKEKTEWDTGEWKKQKYLLVYAYDMHMNDKSTVLEIKKIAKKEGLKVISCGYYHGWCDECVAADPKEFLEMFKHAKYIVTDTFHGTVFSLILHKNFTSIIRGNGFKVRHLLEQSGMSDRISNNVEDLPNVLHSIADYGQFDNWLREEQYKSFDFIKTNIEQAKRKVGVI